MSRGGIPGALCEATGSVSLESSSLEDPGTIGQRMLSLHLAPFSGSPQRLGANSECSRCPRQRHPTLTLASLLRINRDLVVGSQRGHPLACPTISVTSREPV